MLEVHRSVLPVLLIPLTLLCGGLWRSQRTIVSRALSLSPLTYLGRISYGMYMWHALWFSLMTRLVASESWRMRLTPLCTVAVAAASYTFYEQPFLRAKRRFSSSEPPAALHA
jgi:peptidoglycan/LPS O-acetylase OafA/YrhL